MNRRRILTIMAAVVLTLFGAAIVVAYVTSAEERAQEGAELVSILVAADEIPAGTPASELAGSNRVALRQVPLSIRAEDAVQDLTTLGEQVTVERILAGEAIVERQFGDPAAAPRQEDGEVDAELQVITVSLEPHKALGGQLEEGDLVGVIVSLEGSSGGGDETTGTAPDGSAASGMVLAAVPVTDVSGGTTTNAEGAGGGSAPNAPVLVSLQVTERQAERVAFGAEFGRLWLTRQGEGAEVDTSRRTGDNIYKGLAADANAQDAP